MVKKILIGLFAFILLLALVYLLGPKPDYPALNGKLPEIPENLLTLENEIALEETGVSGIKPPSSLTTR